MARVTEVPLDTPEWYSAEMSGTHTFTVGDRGRVVLPIALRQRRDWRDGTVLFAVEDGDGVRVMTREELRKVVAEQLRGPSLVDELIAERRAEAARDNE